uniref:Putative secreted protein n=1 Tax=Anopheles darlingi TaxID=43151 RepID=A0A2M4DCU0_ANODA
MLTLLLFGLAGIPSDCCLPIEPKAPIYLADRLPAVKLPTPAPSRAFAVLLLPVLLPLLTNPLDIRSHCRMVSRLMSYRFTSSRSTSYTASDSRALDNGDEQWTPPSLPVGVPPASCTIIRTVDGTLLAASCTYTSSPSVSSS